MKKENYNILYVDDERANLTSLKSLFRRKFNIISANSGQEGLEILEAQPIHIIIADQRMPNMTGVEFLKKVKDKWPNLKYILLTGFYDNEVVKEAVNDVGIFWYMNKPFEVEQMEQIILKAIESYKAEKILKESEEKFRGVFNSMIDVFVRRDLEHVGVIVSPSIFNVTGYAVEEIVGINISKYFVDPKLPEIIKQILLESGGVQTFEIELYKKDGSIITISSNAKIYYDNSGNPLGIESVFHDITAKKNAEQTLRESEENLKLIYNSTSDVLFQLQVEQNDSFSFLSVNQAFLTGTGLTEEQIVGKTTKEIIPEPSHTLVLEKYKEAIRNKRTVRWEETTEYPSGVKVGDVSVAPAFDEDGNCTPLIGSVHDITERKKIGELLKDSEARFRMIYEHAPIMIDAFDENGRCTMFNKECEKVFGWTAEEIYSHENPIELFYPDPEVQKKVIETVNSKPEKTFREWKPKRKDGSEALCLWANFKLPDGQVINVGYDITDSKRAEEDLKKYQSRLKALASELTVTEERERRRIATDLHDNVSQSLALSRVQLATVQKSISEKKLKSIITEVSETMLQAAMETRHLIFDLSSPSMNEIGLSAAISEWLDGQVGERHGIETEFIDNITADKRKTLNENDRVVLFRNVREVLTNVVKHARANKVKVCLKQEGENMKIIVEDDGVGFEQNKISGSNQDEGGFGLFSVQELMTDLGGTMEISSKPGEGTKIILTIPSVSDNYEQGK